MIGSGPGVTNSEGTCREATQVRICRGQDWPYTSKSGEVRPKSRGRTTGVDSSLPPRLLFRFDGRSLSPRR